MYVFLNGPRNISEKKNEERSQWIPGEAYEAVPGGTVKELLRNPLKKRLGTSWEPLKNLQKTFLQKKSEFPKETLEEFRNE